MKPVAFILIPGGRSLRPVKNRRSFVKDVGPTSHFPQFSLGSLPTLLTRLPLFLLGNLKLPLQKGEEAQGRDLRSKAGGPEPKMGESCGDFDSRFGEKPLNGTNTAPQ